MPKKHAEILRRNRTDLERDLLLHHMTSHLQENGVISELEYQDITIRSDASYEKNRKFIDILSKKDHEKFEKFMNVLVGFHPDLATTLRNTDVNVEEDTFDVDEDGKVTGVTIMRELKDLKVCVNELKRMWEPLEQTSFKKTERKKRRSNAEPERETLQTSSICRGDSSSSTAENNSDVSNTDCSADVSIDSGACGFSEIDGIGNDERSDTTAVETLHNMVGVVRRMSCRRPIPAPRRSRNLSGSDAGEADDAAVNDFQRNLNRLSVQVTSIEESQESTAEDPEHPSSRDLQDQIVHLTELVQRLLSSQAESTQTTSSPPSEEQISQEDLNDKLQEAVKKGEKDKISEFLQKGANINVSGKHGFTPLIHAIRSKNLEVSKLLIESGCDVNICDNRQGAPLHWATYHEDNSMLARLLIDRGAKINHQDSGKRTALMFAVFRKRMSVTQVLLENRADVNLQEDSQRTAADIAMEHGLDDFCSMLQSTTSDMSYINLIERPVS